MLVLNSSRLQWTSFVFLDSEDIVGTFRKELEHRMMLQDLKIDTWSKKGTESVALREWLLIDSGGLPQLGPSISHDCFIGHEMT